MRRPTLAIVSAIALVAATPVLAQEADLDAQIKIAETQLAKLKKLKDLRAEISALENESKAVPPAAAVATTETAPAEPAAAPAPATEVAGTPDEKKNEPITVQQELANSEAPTRKFACVSFGIGLAFTYDVGDNDRVRDAELVNGIVRVKEQRNQDAGLVLELHYFITPKRKFLGLENIAALKDKPGKSEWGIGPFIAVRPGSDEVIDAIGGGIMIGLKRPAVFGSKAAGNNSFNIGVGVMYDLGVQILGEGITPNAPLPAGETAIRYRKTSQTGVLLTSSYSF